MARHGLLRLLLALLLGVALPLMSLGRQVDAACAQYSLPDVVQRSDLIVIGTVTGVSVDPPLDPAVPDSLAHTAILTVQTDEYLKGQAPASLNVIEQGLKYVFQDGQVYTQATDVTYVGFDLPDELIGKPVLYLLLGDASNPVDPVCSPSTTLNYPFGQELLQQIRAILSATPTPGPEPSSTPSPQPSLTPGPIVEVIVIPEPVRLPTTGGGPPTRLRATVSALPAAVLVSLGLLGAYALISRRRT